MLNVVMLSVLAPDKTTGRNVSNHEDDENNLPDAFHLNSLMIRRNRVGAVLVVFVDAIDDAIERRWNAEGHREWDDDERQGEEQDRVADVALKRFFLVKQVPGRGPEQRESEKTVLYLQIIIILIS